MELIPIGHDYCDLRKEHSGYASTGGAGVMLPSNLTYPPLMRLTKSA